MKHKYYRILNIEENTLFQLHQNLGKLFYAIAAVDKTIREEEINAVYKWVRKYWLKQDFIATSSQNDAVKNIIDTFKWHCKDKEYDAKTCYNSFISFKKLNESIFTNDINTLILKTAGKIAASFSGQNKSELIMLAKLNIELKKSTT